jgi:4-hydroxy-2-oxoheptanedioate aldolase
MTRAALRFKEKLRAGATVKVVNPDYSSGALVEFLGRQELGVDAVMIDTEQGSAGAAEVEDLARAARAADLCSLVRVFAPEPWAIERLMFRGVDGIVVPRLDRAADARRVVEAVRYCFPADFASKIVVVQIESATAYGELDAFLALDGIDVLFVGPVDLAKSMGRGGDYSHPAVDAAIRDTLRRAKAAGRAAGMMARLSDRSSWADEGARFLYFHVNDWIRQGAKSFP